MLVVFNTFPTYQTHGGMWKSEKVYPLFRIIFGTRLNQVILWSKTSHYGIWCLSSHEPPNFEGSDRNVSCR